MSWPTALTPGRGSPATARTMASSLNAFEIVRRAASAPEDDDVHIAHALKLHRERAADRLDRVGPLHLRRREEDARAATPERDAADVVNDGARRRS